MSHIQGDLHEDQCWVTDYTPNRDGYVRVSLPAGQPRTLAHRFMWEVHNAEPLGDRVLMHSCDNPGCINPAHLTPGTPTENHADCVAKGRNFVPDPMKLSPAERIEIVNSDLPMAALAEKLPCTISNIRFHLINQL